MPTIEVEREDLEALLGIKLPRSPEELDEIFSFIKGEAKYVDENEIHIDIKDSNRADLWGVEGIARALRGILGIETGIKRYEIAGDSGVKVYVNESLRNIRPYIACAVVKNVRLTDAAIRHIMRFQDKMDQTYGRSRRRTSIGLYDFDLIVPPLKYTVSKPDETKFVPLGFDEELTLREILEKHPKGIMYGHIVKPYDIWPILKDSRENVLSFPPIINSNDLGRVTVDTRNILIEVTGTVYETVLYTLTNVTFALADRGGTIHSAEIYYPYGDLKYAKTPDFRNERMKISVKYVHEIIGIPLSIQEVINLLERSRYGVSEVIDEDNIVVEIPCYRPDIMHPIDIIEDIAIAYDLNKMQPRWPPISTAGGLHPETMLRDLIRELMVGLGYQEVLTFTLSNPDTLFRKMNILPEKVVELANPRVSWMTCLRNWLLPNLMEFLSHNTHVEYPQKIFEVGYCVVHDEKQVNKTRDIEKLGCVTIHSNASFAEIKSTLDALLTNLGLKYDLEETSHGSFIEGRVGKIIIEGEETGLIGEIHPQVLQNWNLENPAAALELDLSKIWRYIKR